jgi:hypothetical protein
MESTMPADLTLADQAKQFLVKHGTWKPHWFISCRQVGNDVLFRVVRKGATSLRYKGVFNTDNVMIDVVTITTSERRKIGAAASREARHERAVAKKAKKKELAAAARAAKEVNAQS